ERHAEAEVGEETSRVAPAPGRWTAVDEAGERGVEGEARLESDNDRVEEAREIDGVRRAAHEVREPERARDLERERKREEQEAIADQRRAVIGHRNREEGGAEWREDHEHDRGRARLRRERGALLLEREPAAEQCRDALEA